MPDRRRGGRLRRGRPTVVRPAALPPAERHRVPLPSICSSSTGGTYGASRFEVRKRQLATLLRHARCGLQLNEHITELGDVVFRHACKLGFEGIVSKRLGSRYTSGRTRNWLKMKNPAAPAVKREAEEE